MEGILHRLHISTRPMQAPQVNLKNEKVIEDVAQLDTLLGSGVVVDVESMKFAMNATCVKTALVEKQNNAFNCYLERGYSLSHQDIVNIYDLKEDSLVIGLFHSFFIEKIKELTKYQFTDYDYTAS